MTDATELDGFDWSAWNTEAQLAHQAADLTAEVLTQAERVRALLARLDATYAELETWKQAARVALLPRVQAHPRSPVLPRGEVGMSCENCKAAEAALAAVRALVGPANPRSATAGSAYSTGRWDAFAEVRAVLESEVEDGVFGDPDIHARLTCAALATTMTPEETQP